MASLEEGNSIIQDEEISKASVDFFQGSYGSYDSHHKLDNLEFGMIGKETVVRWINKKSKELRLKWIIGPLPLGLDEFPQ